LLRQGRFVLGVSNAPLFGELAHGEVGTGAFLNDRPLQVSQLARLDEASLSLGNIHTLATGPGWTGLGRLISSVNRTRGYGDFYHYHRLAAGQLDLVVESDLNILDVAALSVILQEAGGRITELSGAPLGPDSTSVLASNGLLHDPALALLGRS
ncbi:MAG: inositol monophosphatase family protein, partial [Candidatus Competibacteraceae bacterium]|nr:inositol monophosphatase family protein [Candidatus Competibacteraceae bacterium]